MHSTLIMVESMSATSSALRRSPSAWTTTSTPSSSPSIAFKASAGLCANGRSQARSRSIQRASEPWTPAEARASRAAEISPPASLSFAIRVAMNIQDPAPPLALIAGPTASGKSALALALAERTGGTIVNADSAQVYRDLAIVTARPSPEEEARVAHRLYGYRDGADPCSAADWAADARPAIDEAHRLGSLPILVGGTGLYLRTLLDGIAPVPQIDPAIRAEVRALDVAWAHER